MRTVDPFYTGTKRICFSFLISICFVLLVLNTSCNKENDGFSSEGITQIAGVWTAKSATFNGVDVVAEGGNVVLEISKNGRFNFTIQRPGKDDMVFTGRLGFDEEWLAVEYDTNPGEYEYYDITYTAKTMFIGANSIFDFNDDGEDEFVVFFLDLVK